MATKTVGELIKELQKFNPATPVIASVEEHEVSDSGTGFSFTVDREIDGVVNLETRIVVTTGYTYYPSKNTKKTTKIDQSSTPGYAGRDEQGGSDYP